MPRHYHSYSDLPKSLPLFPLTGAVLLPRGDHARVVEGAQHFVVHPLKIHGVTPCTGLAAALRRAARAFQGTLPRTYPLRARA